MVCAGEGMGVGDGQVIFILKVMIGDMIRGVSDVCTMHMYLDKIFQTI